MEQIAINQNENQIINLYSNEPQIITLSNTNLQDININQNEIQDINIKNKENQILYIEGNGNIIGITDVLVNGISVVSDGIAYVITPTKTSELINNSGFITNETDPTIPSYIKSITQADINSWNNKQNQLVSGVNIKTVNDENILGSGNIEIDIPTYTSGTGIDITNYEISNTITSYNDLTDLPTIPTQTSDLTNDSNFVTSDELSDVAFSGSYTDLSNAPDIPTDTSDLINDSGFIDKNVNDLTNYTLTSTLTTWNSRASNITINSGYTLQENRTYVNQGIKLCYVHINVKATSTSGDIASGLPKALESMTLYAMNATTNTPVLVWIRAAGTLACYTPHAVNDEIKVSGCYPYSSL